MTLNNKSKQRIYDQAIRDIRDKKVSDPIYHIVDIWENAIRAEYIRLGINIPAQEVKEFFCVESDDE